MQALPSIPNPRDFLQLSPAEQIALDSAEAHVDRQLMHEHHDASRRGQTLKQELTKIIHLALQKNANGEATLKIWAHGFEKMFKEAGRTDFALDLIRMRLEDIEESVRKGETVGFSDFSLSQVCFHSPQTGPRSAHVSSALI